MKYNKGINIICDEKWNILFFIDIDNTVFKKITKPDTKIRFYSVFYKKNILNHIHILRKINTVLRQKFILTTRNNLLVNSIVYIEKQLIYNKSYYNINIILLHKYIELKTYNYFINLYKIFNFITRLKFAAGSIIPYMLGVLWANQYIRLNYDNIPIIVYMICCLVLLHTSANLYNDYFDWQSNADQLNTNYVFNISGGSRSIQIKLLTPKQVLILAHTCSLLVLILGFYIAHNKALLLFLGCIGYLVIFFYTAPPIKLAYRKGYGELLHILCLGPCITITSIYSLTNQVSLIDFWIGLPMGLLITACLCANEYPDIKSDKVVNKYNFITLSVNKFHIIVASLIIISYLCIIFGIIIKYMPSKFLIILLPIRFILYFINIVSIKKKTHKMINQICVDVFKIYLYFFLLMITGIIILYW